MKLDAARRWRILRQLQLDLQEKTQQLTVHLPVIPALISWTKFFGAAFIVLIIYNSMNRDLVFWTVLVCALSDYADGWVARRMNRATYPGKVLDFTTDKLFLSVVLLAIAFHMDALDRSVAMILAGYHFFLLFSLSAISWSIHVPVVTITTGERLAVLFSYLLLITATGRIVFPHKHIFRSLYTPLTIFAVLSAVTGLLSYLRLLRRILTRFLE